MSSMTKESGSSELRKCDSGDNFIVHQISCYLRTEKKLKRNIYLEEKSTTIYILKSCICLTINNDFKKFQYFLASRSRDSSMSCDCSCGRSVGRSPISQYLRMYSTQVFSTLQLKNEFFLFFFLLYLLGGSHCTDVEIRAQLTRFRSLLLRRGSQGSGHIGHTA